MSADTQSSAEAAPATQPASGDIALAKSLLRSTRAGALASLESGSGAPLATLTSVATDHDGNPILLTSGLSLHTRNMKADPRVSLLLARAGRGDPLAHPRLSLHGQAIEEKDAETRTRLRGRFLARHPKAAFYVDFADFSFWRIIVSGAHLNAGFARAMTIPGARLVTDVAGARDLIEAEAEALAHLNADHASALAAFATRLAGARPASWRATGLDPEGLDLAAGGLTQRIDFPRPVRSASELRGVLLELAQAARAR